MGLAITIAEHAFPARFEFDLAPNTCRAFQALLPFHEKLIHARWSGEACWVPLGSLRLDVGHESATSHPAPGQIIFYPGGASETELLVPYGPVRFASKAGQLAGNHFLTITDKLDLLGELARDILWNGAQPISFRAE